MNTSASLARACSFYATFARAASWLQSPLLLVLRLYWGWSFFGTGKGKLTHLGQTAEYFQSISIPFPTVNALMAGTIECVGGLFLLAGLASRLTAIPLIFVMIVAYATAEKEALQSITSDPDKFTGATPFLFMLAAVIVLAFGPGVFSLDWIIGRKCCGGAATSK